MTPLIIPQQPSGPHVQCLTRHHCAKVLAEDEDIAMVGQTADGLCAMKQVHVQARSYQRSSFAE